MPVFTSKSLEPLPASRVAAKLLAGQRAGVSVEAEVQWAGQQVASQLRTKEKGEKRPSRPGEGRPGR